MTGGYYQRVEDAASPFLRVLFPHAVPPQGVMGERRYEMLSGYTGCFLFILFVSIVCVVIAYKCRLVRDVLSLHFYIPWVIFVNFISAILFLSPYGFAG